MQANCTGLTKGLLNLERGSTFSSAAWIYPSPERTKEKQIQKWQWDILLRAQSDSINKSIFYSSSWTSTQYSKHSSETFLYWPPLFTVANTKRYYSEGEHFATEKDPSRSFQIYIDTRGCFHTRANNSEKEHKCKPCLSWALQKAEK